MKKKQKKIQIGLLIIGIFLILATYFYYPYINKNRLALDENIIESLESSPNNLDEKSTSFENIQYEGLYDFETAYGYSGPVATTTSPEFLTPAWDCFRVHS